MFGFQLPLTKLCPDIALFSKSSKRAVLLESTCPYEENMQSWHFQKLNILHLLRSLRAMTGLLISLLLKLALVDTLPGRYQFALKDWVLIIKLLTKQLNL